MAEPIRLQKILSQWGLASRRQAEAWILAGEVTLNGQLAQVGDKADPSRDEIKVRGKLIKPGQRPEPLYLLLHKPTGYVTTCDDPQGRPTVMDLLPPQLRQEQGLHPVGRLDCDTSGALLITNDGELTHILTHPSHLVAKSYQLWVRGIPTTEALNHWRKGVMLAGRMTLPAQVKMFGQRSAPPPPRAQSLQYLPAVMTRLEIILKEGRNRQIRRVADQLGYPVIYLHRTGIEQILLDSPGQQSLLVGEYRHLHAQELYCLQELIYRAGGNHKILPDSNSIASQEALIPLK